MNTLLALTLLCLALLPSTAQALDCTPDFSWDCSNNGYFDLLVGEPGGMLCGTDYTGWTFHTVEFTVTTAGFYIMQGISAQAAQQIVETTLILMDDCGNETCVDSATSSGVTTLYTCLDVGTHTFVVASNTQAPTGFMNIGFLCATCEDADAVGYFCAHCQTVDLEDGSWGSVKSRFE